MTTHQQDQAFAQDVCSSLLEETIDWIRTNLQPEEVFDLDELHAWASDSGFVTEADCEARVEAAHAEVE